MKRSLTILLTPLAGAVLCLAALGRAETEALRIGVVQSLFRYATKAEAKTSVARFETFIRNRTGLGGEFVTVDDAFELAEQVENGKLDLGTFHGIEFAWVKQKYPKLI